VYSVMLKPYSAVSTNKRTHAKAFTHKTTDTVSLRDAISFK